MTRGIYTKWIVGAAFVLLIIAAGCIWYYQHTTAQDREQAAQAEKRLQQWKANKEQKPTIKAETEETDTPAENTTSTAEKPTTDTTAVTKNTEPIQVQSDVPAQTAETTDVQVSPHGFGPYPEVPDDYPGYIEWKVNPDNPSRTFELMGRVFVKLWTEGEKNFRGGSTHKDKILPHYNDVVYISWSEYTDPTDGELVRRISGYTAGPHVSKKFKFTIDDLYDPPPGLRVLDIESSGINPYEYLNLHLEKGEYDVQ